MTEQKAIYKEQFLSEYAGNPLIEALPPVWDEDEVIDMLSHNDGHNDGERKFPPHHRLHYVRRLFRYFQPLEQHVDIEQRFSGCIRQGYLHRNPILPDYARALAEGHSAIKNGGGYASLNAYKPTAASFTIIGLSGVGKTSAVRSVLDLYPQVIEHSRYHDTPFVLKQIVWLKLDCPYDGSINGLCMGFFDAVDQAAGTNYFESYSKRTVTIDVTMVRMAQAARLHCIGVLVIDEIQHLSLAKSGGAEKMLNFFVTLVNTIGVPVVMIGTSKAKAVLQSEFRQARRGSSQGDLLWDRMKNNDWWNIFVSSMWGNQWTAQNVPLTAEFRDALYYESQGITDIAVKLYIMVQIRAIGSRTETFSPDDFKVVASEKLGLVKSALDALRSGNKKRIDAIGDIAPVSVEDYYNAYAALLPKADEIPGKSDKISLSEQAVLTLLSLNVEPIEAKRLVGKIMAKHPDIKNPAGVAHEAFKLHLAQTENSEETHENEPLEDDAREQGNYDAMKSAGLISEVSW
jgi:hypothetical protein